MTANVRRGLFFCAASAFLFAGEIRAASVAWAPEWLRHALSVPTPENIGSAPALVLLDEIDVDVSADGIATTTRRLAVRILAQAGRTEAQAGVSYVQNHDRVRGTKAWLVRNDKIVKPTDRSEWADVSIDTSGTLFGEFRSRVTNRVSDAVVGDVFAAETQLEEPMLTTQLGNLWQWRLPVVQETYRLTVPPGFSILPQMHGTDGPEMELSPDGRMATWTKRDQPFVRSELLMPERDPNRPALFVTLQPPAGASRFKPLVLKDWTDVARWIGALNAAQCDTSPQLSETALRLTADRTMSADKIRALGSYVQKLRYVARNEGIGKGFGYQAHKATQVFSHGYGDCKDKANLLRAMLREVGITAFTAAARSGDDRPIRPEFPSPLQFDHAIAAIQVDETVDFPAVVQTEKWGRVLFFDPTDPHTAVGDLPLRLQGTFVHIDHPESDRLVELPRIAPAQGHLYERKVSLELASDGSVAGRISLFGRGQAGARLRREMFVASTEQALRDFVTEQLGESARAAQLKALAREENTTGSECGITFELSKTNFLQPLRNGLAVARLDILGRGEFPVLPAPTRQSPIKLSPVAWDDTVELLLPEGLALEEIPAAASLVSEFGSYARTIQANGRMITLTRRAEINPALVPASNYAALKKFLSDVSKADRTSVLLKTGS